jgi:YD repeat-containing protein
VPIATQWVAVGQATPALRVVGSPPPVRSGKGLGRQVLGQVSANAMGDKPVDLREMLPERVREILCTSPYVKSAAGTGGYCVLPEDQDASLIYSSGTYTFTPAPGATTYTYTAATGALASEADSDGDTLTITYNSPSPGGTVTTGGGTGTCPTAATSCETMTSASGRALILGYNALSDTGQTTSVTDPMNRTWTYGYNTASQLTTVTDPVGNVTTYTYGTGTGNTNAMLANDLLTVTEPNAQPGGPDAGDATVNVYNNQGQVTSQTDPTGIVTNFNYCVSAAAGDCLNASTGTGQVTITTSGGADSVDAYTQGVLTSETTWNGSTPSEQDYGPALTAVGLTAGTLLPGRPMPRAT